MTNLAQSGVARGISAANYHAYYPHGRESREEYHRHAIIVAGSPDLKVIFSSARVHDYNFVVMTTSAPPNELVVLANGFEVETESSTRGGPTEDLTHSSKGWMPVGYTDPSGTRFYAFRTKVPVPWGVPGTYGNEYHVTIPFTLNDDSFVADFTFEYKEGWRLVESIGVPGGTP